MTTPAAKRIQLNYPIGTPLTDNQTAANDWQEMGAMGISVSGYSITNAPTATTTQASLRMKWKAPVTTPPTSGAKITEVIVRYIPSAVLNPVKAESTWHMSVGIAGTGLAIPETLRFFTIPNVQLTTNFEPGPAEANQAVRFQNREHGITTAQYNLLETLERVFQSPVTASEIPAAWRGRTLAVELGPRVTAPPPTEEEEDILLSILTWGASPSLHERHEARFERGGT